MKFFIFGEENMWTAGAWRLSHFEGHDVRMFASKEGKEHLQNMVEHVSSMEEGLKFVGKDGYIICEDEKDVTNLRKQGYRVYGGNKYTEQIENDREFELNLCKEAGIPVSNYHIIKSVKEGVDFIKKHPDAYALKQMGHAPKTWNYVGKEEDGSDVIDQLEWISQQEDFKKMDGKIPFLLQEIVEGIELAVGAWWMYDDWKRDDDGNVIIEINREHKKCLDGDNGLTCGEAGTVMKFTTEETKLFDETLNKLTPFLKKNASDVCINIDANCGIVEEDGKSKAYVFELTPREGYPASAMQQFLFDTEIGQFFADLIDGVQGNVEWKKDWGVITVLGSGLYPEEQNKKIGRFKDQPVKFPFPTDRWDDHVSPFYIKYDKEKDYFRIADYYEYVCGVMYVRKKICDANKQCLEMMESITVRSPHFRHDIGEKFEKEICELIEMGYLEKE